MQDDRFVTALCVLLDAPNRRWIFANAGHVLPLLRRSTGVVSRVAYSSGPPPLGIVAHAQYREETISVAAKDILLLATDGVVEILSAPRRPCSTMGVCQFTDLVTSAPHDIRRDQPPHRHDRRIGHQQRPRRSDPLGPFQIS